MSAALPPDGRALPALAPAPRRGETRAERERRYRREAKKKGLCQACKRRNPQPGKTVCLTCAEENNTRSRRRSRARLKAGKCWRCGVNDPPPGRRTCPTCKDKRDRVSAGKGNTTRKRRRRQKLCAECGEGTAIDHTRCLQCRKDLAEKKKLRRQERIDAGLCYRCGKTEAPAGESCLRCKKRRRSRRGQRKDPIPVRLQTCSACGEMGHRKSERACPLFAGRPWQRGKPCGRHKKRAERVDGEAGAITVSG